MISKTFLLTIITALGSLLLQVLHARTLSAEGFLMLKTANSSEESRNGSFRIQMQESGKDTLVTEEESTKSHRAEDVCPEDSDCEEFLDSIKYFVIEFFATFAGLSWGAWSNLVIAFNQINS